MEVQRIEDGLWRWTAAHPDWRPGADWPQEVGCVYWEADDAVALVDPLVPAESADRHRFLEALDRDVARAGRPVEILLTCEWHGRSADELAGRYGGTVRQPGDPLFVTGAESVFASVAAEAVYWLAPARALVSGDVLLGAAGGLTLCPEAWLEWRGGLPQLARDLAPLLELPVERVLTSHGPPVLAGGRAALAQAVGAA